MSYGEPLANHIRWLTFRNDSGEVIPPFAALRPTGVTVIDGAGVHTCGKPSEDNETPLLFNGPAAVADGKFGACTKDFPCEAMYTGSTPAVGDDIGAVANDWYLAKDNTGYRVVGVNSGSTRVTVLEQPVAAARAWYGTVAADYDVDEPATVTPINPAGESFVAANPFGPIASGARVAVLEIGGTKYVIAASCPP